MLSDSLCLLLEVTEMDVNVLITIFQGMLVFNIKIIVIVVHISQTFIALVNYHMIFKMIACCQIFDDFCVCNCD